jgi:hypothetical protein
MNERVWDSRYKIAAPSDRTTRRRLGQTYSNAFVEKHPGIPATARNWNTFEALCEILVNEGRDPQIQV